MCTLGSIACAHIGRADHPLLIRRPEGVRELAAHAAVERRARLLWRRDRRELADGAAQVPRRRGECEPRVLRERAAVLARELRDLSHELVDGLVGRARVEADRKHLVEGEVGRLLGQIGAVALGASPADEGVGHRAKSAQECCDKCKKHGRCNSWTFCGIDVCWGLDTGWNHTCATFGLGPKRSHHPFHSPPPPL